MSTMDEQPIVELRRGYWLRIATAATVVGLIAAYACYFQVAESTAVVVTRFGRPVRQISAAGPYWKWPWPIDQVHEIDTRSRMYEVRPTEMLTRDRKNVLLHSFIVWRVAEPLQFLQSAGTAAQAEERLDGMVIGSELFQLGTVDLTALVSTNSSEIHAAEVEQAVLADIQKAALEKFGVSIEHFGIKLIGFGEANIKSVMDQMRSERRAVAAQLRAEGEKEARRIRDEALVLAEQKRSEGRAEAGRIRGEAEQRAAEIYTHAEQLDVDFFRYWRQLDLWKRTLRDNATILLGTEDGPFKGLITPPGGGAIDSDNVTQPAVSRREAVP